MACNRLPLANTSLTCTKTRYTKLYLEVTCRFQKGSMVTGSVYSSMDFFAEGFLSGLRNKKPELSFPYTTKDLSAKSLEETSHTPVISLFGDLHVSYLSISSRASKQVYNEVLSRFNYNCSRFMCFIKQIKCYVDTEAHKSKFVTENKRKPDCKDTQTARKQASQKTIFKRFLFRSQSLCQ